MLFLDVYFQIYRKQYFDYDQPNIELFTFHPQLRLLVALNGLFFNNRQSPLRFVWPFVCVGMSLVGFVLETMEIVHAFFDGNLQLFTECFAYWVLIGVVPILYTCTFVGAKSIYRILDNMNADFKIICALGEPYRFNFLKGQLMIWQFGFMWMTFILIVAISYVLLSIVALLHYTLFVTQDEYSVRPLIFPIWLPEDDPHRTPNFEIFMICEYVMMAVFVLTFTVYVYIKFHLLLHNCIKIDMIIIAIGRIFDEMDESVAYLNRTDQRWIKLRLQFNRKFRTIINWHNEVFEAVNTVQSIYGPIIVYQVMLSSVAICLMAFQVAEQLDHGKFDILFTLLTVATLIQLWIPCYLGSILREKGFAIGDAAFMAGWHNTPLVIMVHSDLRIIIFRSQKPINIQLTGIPPLKLETFSSITSSAYSYFNMLRQTTKT